MGGVGSAGAVDGFGNGGGGVWAGVAGGCGAVVAVVAFPLPLVCYWTSPCL